jgi:hypothetical protein
MSLAAHYRSKHNRRTFCGRPGKGLTTVSVPQQTTCQQCLDTMAACIQRARNVFAAPDPQWEARVEWSREKQRIYMRGMAHLRDKYRDEFDDFCERELALAALGRIGRSA